MRGTSVVTKILLVVAFLAAVGLRLGYYHLIHRGPSTAATTRPAGDRTDLTKEAALRDKVWDREGYDGVLARNLRLFKKFAAWAPLSGREPWEGDGDNPPPGTAFVAPGYPVLLAAVYALAPISDVYLAVYIVQAVIGALGCLFTFYLARRVFRSTFVGWLALIASAVSYFLVSAVVRIEPAVLAGTLVTASVLTIVGAADTASFWRHLVAGIVAGLTVLVVPAYLIVLPFAYLWTLAYGTGSGGKRFGLSLVSVLFFALTVAPWTVRNWRVFGRAVPIADSFGYHFYVGNNPLATGDERADDGRLIVARALHENRLTVLETDNEVDRFGDLARQGWQWLVANPDRSVELRLRAYAFFWTGRDAWLDRKLTYQHPLALPVTLLMFVLALVGVGARKTPRQRNLAWMIYVVLLVYPLPYAVTHATTRPILRLALDPLLLILAAYAVATLLTGGLVGRERGTAATEDPDDSIPLAR